MKEKKFSWSGLLTMIGMVAVPLSLVYFSTKDSNCSKEQKTKTKIMDTFKIGDVYSQPMDSIYKELGIDKTKYSQKQLDSLVAEAYQNILW